MLTIQGGFMDQSFHYLIMITQSLFHKKIMTALYDEGLTRGQPKVLDYLSHHDGCIQKDIAHACQIEAATLSGIIKRMAEKGYLEKKYKDNNHRAVHIYLTPLGHDFAQKVNSIFLDAEQTLFETITQEEKKQFLETFKKICLNMTSEEGLQ